MQLDARLAAIAAFVPHGTVLADIGGDHAYLAATLVMEGVAPRAVVGDLSAGACAAARRTALAQRLTRQIDVRQGDGLSVLAPGEAESIVIAGMGGALIVQILEGAPDVLAGAPTLVLQPMNGAESCAAGSTHTAGTSSTRPLRARADVSMRSSALSAVQRRCRMMRCCRSAQGSSRSVTRSSKTISGTRSKKSPAQPRA